MILPEHIAVWELRKWGGQVLYKALLRDDQPVGYIPRERVSGKCRWYRRVRGQRWTPMCDWMNGWPPDEKRVT